MKNQVQKGVNLTLPAPADVLSGELVVVGAIFGVAAGDALSGELVDLVTGEVFDLPKVATQVIGFGDKLYFDSATKLVTKTASGNTYIGVAVSAAANLSAAVNVRLNPSF